MTDRVNSKGWWQETFSLGCVSVRKVALPFGRENRVSNDRLSPLDASFLHLEDDVSHMHIASVAIFEGPPPLFTDVLAMVDAKLALVPRYRQVVRTVPFDLGRPVWADDPHFNIEYHLRHTALPAPGSDERAAQAGGPGHVPATGPVQAAVGDLDGRGTRGRPLGHAVQDPPRHGRRGGGHRPAGGDHGHQPRRRASGARGLGAPARPRTAGGWRPTPWLDFVRSPYEQVRAARASTRFVRQAPRPTSEEVVGGLVAMAGLVRPTPVSSLNGPIGPHRRYAWASTSVDDIKRVRKARGWDVQRRHPGLDHLGLP